MVCVCVCMYKAVNDKPKMDVLCFINDLSMVEWDTEGRMLSGECWTLKYIHQIHGDLQLRESTSKTSAVLTPIGATIDESMSKSIVLPPIPDLDM